MSQWQRVDEDPYRIHSEAAEDGDKITHTGSAFDEPDMTAALSSSDDEAALTEDEGGDTPNGSASTLDDQEAAELAKHMPSISREESSPNEETVNDWGEIDDELKDFLGSDADDDSETDMESTKSEESTNVDPSPSDKKKRKRDHEANSVTDDSDSDASIGSPESKLQRRKRKALERPSSLANVTAVSSVATPDSQKPEVKDAPQDEDDGSDGDLEAELEAEMLRQAEEEDEHGL